MEKSEMLQQHDFDPTTVDLIIEEVPIKTAGAERVSPELLEEQGQAAVESLTPVDYTEDPGTCGDERKRVSLYSGDTNIKPRPSVFGGPNIYTLAAAELTGYFGSDDTTTGEERLERITDRIEDADLKSGGHGHCAANGGINVWMGVIAENPDAIKAYARKEKGTDYDDVAMDAVIENARAVVASGRYANWTEDVLVRVLGDKAGHAMENLAGEHEGLSLVRNRIPNTTVDQTELFDKSVVGKGSFVHDDGYADKLEHVVASGIDAERKKIEAEHAREAILAAVASVVPNKEIYQINLGMAA